MVADGYEPKLRALSFYEVFFAGVTMIVAEALAIIGVSIVGTALHSYLDDDETNTEDELESLHNEISSKRSELLVAVAAVWLAVPFCLSHIYLYGRVLESYFVASNGISSSIVSYAKWVYILCFIIGTALFNAVGAMFVFITSYYSWEFSDTDGDTSYTGYYIQFLTLRTVFGALDSVGLVFAAACTITFFLGFLSTKNVFYRLLFVLIILFICFDAVACVFDWAESGFWSVGGFSQAMGGNCILVRICFASVCLVYCFASCLL